MKGYVEREWLLGVRVLGIVIGFIVINGIGCRWFVIMVFVFVGRVC